MYTLLASSVKPRKQHDKETEAKQTEFVSGVEQGEGKRDSLQQSLGLPGGVFRLEVLVGFHFMLDGQQLSLQFVPEVWEGVPNVVGKLLNKTKQNCIAITDYFDLPCFPNV